MPFTIIWGVDSLHVVCVVPYLSPVSFDNAEYVDTAIRHVLMRQGMLGVKVQIMLPHDPTGKSGPKVLMGDQVIIKDPKE